MLALRFACTRIPHFSEVATPLCIYKRPTLVPVFDNVKKPEDDFTWRKGINEISVQRLFYSSPHRGSAHLESDGAKLLPRELHSGSQH